MLLPLHLLKKEANGAGDSIQVTDLILWQAVVRLLGIFSHNQIDTVHPGHDGAFQVGSAVVKVDRVDEIAVVMLDLIAQSFRQVAAAYLQNDDLMLPRHCSITLSKSAHGECSVATNFTSRVEPVVNAKKLYVTEHEF